jgi:O-acetyl-ADP-ribose deacetylase (regulator of RNase III)
MSRKYPGRRGSNRLVLTALGGGVFRNPRKMIIDAIATAKDLIRESGLQVYFVCFNEQSYRASVEAGIKNLVDELGGRVVTQESEL